MKKRMEMRSFHNHTRGIISDTAGMFGNFRTEQRYVHVPVCAGWPARDRDGRHTDIFHSGMTDAVCCTPRLSLTDVQPTSIHIVSAQKSQPYVMTSCSIALNFITSPNPTCVFLS